MSEDFDERKESYLGELAAKMIRKLYPRDREVIRRMREAGINPVRAADYVAYRLDSYEILSDSERLQIGIQALRHFFGGDGTRPFEEQRFLGFSRMCLSGKDTWELGHVVWPEIFAENQCSPCPLPEKQETIR